MTSEGLPTRLWSPKPGGSWRNFIGRVLSVPCYPFIFPLSVCPDPLTPDVAIRYKWYFSSAFVCCGVVGHGLLLSKYAGRRSCKQHLIGHLCMLGSMDLSWGYLMQLMRWLHQILLVDRGYSRVLSGELRGPRVLVVGNGPSACEGKPLGHEIDAFDEVVRFNNFKTKVDGMEKWVGTKTTVHFSDGCLYPTFTDYHCPGADVVLSLFADRAAVATTYLLMRGGADLEIDLTWRFFMDPSTVWVPLENIRRVQKNVGLPRGKHPTSGMLAIDWYVNQPGVQFPVYIHGFDFFQGPVIHYYHKQEPLYERINNHIGVNMVHRPDLEKIYVQKLIDEGKVKFLKDAF